MALVYAWSANNWSSTTWVTTPGGPTTTSAPTIGSTFDLGLRNTTYDQSDATFDLLLGTSGGQLITTMASAARIIRCDMRAGGSVLVVATGSGSNRFTINGNIYGGSATNAYAINLSTTSALVTINGNLTGGSASGAYAMNCPNCGPVVNGNVIGGSATTAAAIASSGGSAINASITGNVTGGSAANATGISGNAGNITITNGVITGGSGAVAINTTGNLTAADCTFAQNASGQYHPIYVAGTVSLTSGGSGVGFAIGAANYLFGFTGTELQQIRSRLGLDGTQATPTCATSTLPISSSQSFTNSVVNFVKTGTNPVMISAGGIASPQTYDNAGTLALVTSLTNRSGFTAAATLAAGAIASPQTFDLNGSITGSVGSVQTLGNVTVGTNLDKSGYTASATIPSGGIASPQTFDLHGTLSTVTTLTNAPASITPGDVWNYGTRTLTQSGGATAADVWAYGTRTLTMGGGGLTGPYSVSVLWVDSGLSAVPLVDFTVQGRGSGRSSTTGTTTFGSEDGDYVIVSNITGNVVFPNTPFTVSGGDVSLQIEGASRQILPPIAPGFCTCYCTTYKQDGTLDPGAAISYRMIVQNGTGNSYSGSWKTLNSDENGLWQADAIPQNSTYQFIRGDGQAVMVTIPDATNSLLLPNIISGQVV